MEKKIFDVAKYIKDEMDSIDCPDSLSPDNIRKKLNNEKKPSNKSWFKPIAAVACMIILVSAGIYSENYNDSYKGQKTTLHKEDEDKSEEKQNSDDDHSVYKKIYELIKKNKELKYNNIAEKSDSDRAGILNDGNTFSGNDEKYSASTSTNDYASTNVQVSNVDEGDIAKNDGRYLYQIISGENDTESIQIIDTENGLAEAYVISGFSSISEFYVQQDKLVVVESLYVLNDEVENVNTSNIIACYDIAHNGSSFTKLHFYDISDRHSPSLIKTFNIKGSYRSSRISDGFLYLFNTYDIGEPENIDELDKYIPLVEGEYLRGEDIYIPENTDYLEYILMLSIDISKPKEFTDKLAMLTIGDTFYVSENNIYILDDVEAEPEDGLLCNKTQIVRFSYKDGCFKKEADTCIKGRPMDQFAMDESEGYFRIITTLESYKVEKITDDISNDYLGYSITESLGSSNNVYVLNEDLDTVGKIENLAENEIVYSARFMGDIGYFVTFRRTDPLFSVDFSNPYEPKILGSLKIPGFSEYLHFYSDDILVGLGYDADEKTGRTTGIKLSMFDISNPIDVKEINKLSLDYDYSEALDNHNSVMISISKQLIGFELRSYEYGKRVYAVYSIDEEKGFLEKLKLECPQNEYNYLDDTYKIGSVRGTYINDIFYLLKQDYGVESYDLNTSETLEKLVKE